MTSDSYFPNRRRRRKHVEDDLPVVRELVESNEVPIVVWTDRVCVFCGHEEIRYYGDSRCKRFRFYICKSPACGRKWKVVLQRVVIAVEGD